MALDLAGKTLEEQIDIKSDAILLATPKQKVARGKYTIEIVDTEKIDGGIQVFARAWENKKQIGFGEDGTVDIERFRIFNPPIFVEDPNGDILFQWHETDQITQEVKLVEQRRREDPYEKLLQTLEHNLSVMKNIHLDSKIEKDKRGNTTSTFFSNASGDGQVIANNATWATVRGATTGTAAAGGTNSGSDAPRSILFSAVYYIGRCFLPFDTSAIPDGDTISSATFSLYFNSFSGTESTTLEVVQTSQASNTALANGDYDNLTFTSGGSISYPTATAGYKDITLNATGLSWISKTGYTKLGAITGFDLNNSAPTAIRQGSVDYANGTNAPKLVVEHAAAGGNTTNFFYMT